MKKFIHPRKRNVFKNRFRLISFPRCSCLDFTRKMVVLNTAQDKLISQPKKDYIPRSDWTGLRDSDIRMKILKYDVFKAVSGLRSIGREWHYKLSKCVDVVSQSLALIYISTMIESKVPDLWTGIGNCLIMSISIKLGNTY